MFKYHYFSNCITQVTISRFYEKLNKNCINKNDLNMCDNLNEFLHLLVVFINNKKF